MLKALVLAVTLTLASCQVPLRDAAAGENWYALVAELQKKDLDAVDRRFVDWMANQLTVTDTEVTPTRKQQRWLLDIKRRHIGEK
jgi:hypothetical protein